MVSVLLRIIGVYMVSIKKNVEIWDSADHWDNGSLGSGGGLEHGEKWSRSWGDSATQWSISLYPRIKKYLPAESVLEIGAGHGRWSEYLLRYCDQLHLNDISNNCLNYCRQRFVQNDNVSFYKTEGAKLTEIKDNSIDFVFSFDSLVHADLGVIESYIAEINRVLKKGGHAFIHHSNFHQYGDVDYEHNHMRDPTVSAKLFRECCENVGMNCLIQEIIPWKQENLIDEKYIDTISILQSSDNKVETIIKENKLFVQEQEIAQSIYALYNND